MFRRRFVFKLIIFISITWITVALTVCINQISIAEREKIKILEEEIKEDHDHPEDERQ